MTFTMSENGRNWVDIDQIQCINDLKELYWKLQLIHLHKRFH